MGRGVPCEDPGLEGIIRQIVVTSDQTDPPRPETNGESTWVGRRDLLLHHQFSLRH